MEQRRNLKRKRGNVSSSCIPSSSKPSILAIDDRISTLPDPIIHDIFNFLPTKCVALTSILSTRFNFLRWNYPIIDLNEFDLDDRKIRSRFLNCMKRCRDNHDFTFLEKLKIRTREPSTKIFKKNISSLVDTFILRASHANTLKEVELQLHIPIKVVPTLEEMSEQDKFPLRFYLLPQKPLFSSCKSLKILKLRGCRFEANVAMDDDGIMLPFLNELHMKYCLIPHDNFVTKLLDSCPQLETIAYKFNFYAKKIQIFNSNIKHLMLGSYYSESIPEIVAPNLQTFKIKGTHWRHNYSGVGFIRSHLITISAPNVITFFVKGINFYDEDIKMAVTTFKNLKELRFYGCFILDELKFEGEKIEKLTISNCTFRHNYLGRRMSGFE
ncbi:hypothetical protein LIER_15860 [Lithospermum erythrorhizon]|uniref:Uncharacterized protein n=1 Tax=Lithospermum erythrorhizon TaxID=34254 RepID=A0AAV3Q5Y1_LITER